MRQRHLAFLGVAPDDEEAYRLLLRRGEADREELARHIAHADGNGDEHPGLRLRGLGLARETGDGVLHPVSPARAVEHLVDTAVGALRSRLEEQVTSGGTVDSLIAERGVLAAQRPPGGADATIQRLEGMAEVREIIDELTFFTWTESLTTHPGGVLSADSIAHARPLDERILRRGVHMRTLLGAAALDDPATMAYARELTAQGAQIRISHQPLERLIICDRAAALTPSTPPTRPRAPSWSGKRVWSPHWPRSSSACGAPRRSSRPRSPARDRRAGASANGNDGSSKPCTRPRRTRPGPGISASRCGPTGSTWRR
ncbi:hypothetical protein GXW82_10160 [Streptacidiphilus sp. 4-A2]|nr:hypothetical protein [Streptacidiphilus sp. 4-A2]